MSYLLFEFVCVVSNTIRDRNYLLFASTWVHSRYVDGVCVALRLNSLCCFFFFVFFAKIMIFS
jgi:hypothetical protein